MNIASNSSKPSQKKGNRTGQIMAFVTLISSLSTLTFSILPSDLIEYSVVKPNMEYSVVWDIANDTFENVVGQFIIRNTGSFYEEDVEISLQLLQGDKISFEGSMLPDSSSSYHQHNIKDMIIHCPNKFHPKDSLIINFISSRGAIIKYQRLLEHNSKKTYAHPKIKFIRGNNGSYSVFNYADCDNL